MDEPAAANDFQAAHIQLCLESYLRLTGRSLIPGAGAPSECAAALYQAPFVLLSHNTAADPVLTYGNLAAQRLFEMSWEELTSLPSRYTAEAPNREERARLLAQVSAHGFIDDYSGIRIAQSGQRFEIQQATVWNLVDKNGRLQGQAATFSDWVPIRPA